MMSRFLFFVFLPLCGFLVPCGIWGFCLEEREALPILSSVNRRLGSTGLEQCTLEFEPMGDGRASMFFGRVETVDIKGYEARFVSSPGEERWEFDKKEAVDIPFFRPNEILEIFQSKNRGRAREDGPFVIPCYFRDKEKYDGKIACIQTYFHKTHVAFDLSFIKSSEDFLDPDKRYLRISLQGARDASKDTAPHITIVLLLYPLGAKSLVYEIDTREKKVSFSLSIEAGGSLAQADLFKNVCLKMPLVVQGAGGGENYALPEEIIPFLYENKSLTEFFKDHLKRISS